MLCSARVMRWIIAYGVVAETAPETYAATLVIKVYASPAFDAGFRFTYVFEQARDE